MNHQGPGVAFNIFDLRISCRFQSIPCLNEKKGLLPGPDTGILVGNATIRQFVRIVVFIKNNLTPLLSIAFRKGNPPAADPACRLVDKCHNLAASAVCVIASHIVQLTLNTVKQTADGFAVLPRDETLLLPEVSTNPQACSSSYHFKAF